MPALPEFVIWIIIPLLVWAIAFIAGHGYSLGKYTAASQYAARQTRNQGN